jgi:hypothetical protein
LNEHNVTDEKMFEFPYVNTNRVGERMALLPRDKAVKWVVESYGMTVEEYDRKLGEIAANNISLGVVDYTRENSIWICSVPGTLHGWETIKCDSSEEIGGGRIILRGATFQRINNIFPQCHILAAGGNHLPRQLVDIDPCILGAVVDCYGKKGSFGDRKCSQCLGTNSYQGPRCTNATRENPVCGGSNLASTDYYTGSYKRHHAIIALNPIMTLLAKEAATIGRQLHVRHIAFLENSVGHPSLCMLDSVCCNRIITTGIFGSILSFANTHHVDALDALKGDYPGKYKKALEEIGNKNTRKYLESWMDRFGSFDSPTTCGYAHSGSLSPGGVVHQFFSMGGLGCTARLAPGSVHGFFASRFCHNTPVVTLVKNGRVYLRDPDFACFTWGLGKSS